MMMYYQRRSLTLRKGDLRPEMWKPDAGYTTTSHFFLRSNEKRTGRVRPDGANLFLSIVIRDV